MTRTRRAVPALLVSAVAATVALSACGPDTTGHQATSTHPTPAPSTSAAARYSPGTTPDAAGAAKTVQALLSAFANQDYAAACQLMTPDGRREAASNAYNADVSCEVGLQLQREATHLDAQGEAALRSEKLAGPPKVLIGEQPLTTGSTVYTVPTVELHYGDITTADGSTPPLQWTRGTFVYTNGVWLKDE